MRPPLGVDFTHTGDHMGNTKQEGFCILGFFSLSQGGGKYSSILILKNNNIGFSCLKILLILNRIRQYI